MLPTDFQAAKPRRAAPSQREVGAISARRLAQWNGTACCGDSERAPQFPSSQSSESHAQNTTPCVIRQAADGRSWPLVSPQKARVRSALHERRANGSWDTRDTQVIEPQSVKSEY